MTTATQRAGVFIETTEDPREGGPTLGDEKATLVEFLRCQRLTLQLKCADLEPEQLARRSVEPSTMSLLGLVRHMADVERTWFRRVLAGQDAPWVFRADEDPDRAWDGAFADRATVASAWAAWRAEVDYAEHLVAHADDLGVVRTTRHGQQISLREVLVHMIEEYARHNGHADLLRERIDGRVGQ